jgi:hypothetical protein
MKIITILCFETAVVHVFNFNSEKFSNGEEFIEQKKISDLGINENNSQWMIAESLDLKFHSL